MWSKELFFLYLFLINQLEADDWALLSATLRNYVSENCENQHLFLTCPGFTRIAVHGAMYKDRPRLCQKGNNETCKTFAPAPQYSLLQRAVETCHKKSNCLFKSSEHKRCPVYVELAYKCQPNEFHSRVACEGETFSLNCSPNQRIAVFRASFGRTQYESMHCPQPQGVPEETCLSSYASETFMDLCHGRRRCSVTADIATFTKPFCRHQSRLYLKVVYACVPRKVLQQQYVSQLEGDEDSDKDDRSNLKLEDERDDGDSYDYEYDNNGGMFIQTTTEAQNKRTPTLTTQHILISSIKTPDENNDLPTSTLIPHATPDVKWTKDYKDKNKTHFIDVIILYKLHQYLADNHEKILIIAAISVSFGLTSALVFWA